MQNTQSDQPVYYDNHLLRKEIPSGDDLAWRLRRLRQSFGWARGLTGTSIIDDLNQLAGALAVLASYKIGRGGGWTRARQRFARGARDALGRARHVRAASGKRSSSSPGPLENTRRYRDRLRGAVVALWIALLLSILGYIGVRGEAGLADLDAVGFAILAD